MGVVVAAGGATAAWVDVPVIVPMKLEGDTGAAAAESGWFFKTVWKSAGAGVPALTGTSDFWRRIAGDIQFGCNAILNVGMKWDMRNLFLLVL
jgi:hypothetical protein